MPICKESEKTNLTKSDDAKSGEAKCFAFSFFRFSHFWAKVLACTKGKQMISVHKQICETNRFS
jgi:hypothetical protein